jgi:hypothetical protein
MGQPLEANMKGRIALVLTFGLATATLAETNTAAMPSALTNDVAEAPAAVTNQPVAPSEPAATAAPVTSSRAELTTPATEEGAPLVAGGVAATWNRFEVGTRMNYAKLTDDTKHTFLGQIYKLDEQQDLAPTRVFGRWFFLRDWGVELTWDELRAETYNSPDENGVRSSDGDWLISGPIATVIWRYLNDSRWTPDVGAGAGFMSGDTDLAGWWHYGYNSPEQYAALGSPKTPYKAGTRTMDANDAVAFVMTAGCSARITDRWSANVYGRFMSVDVDIHWTTKGEDKGSRTIPFDNYVLGLGVACTF